LKRDAGVFTWSVDGDVFEGHDRRLVEAFGSVQTFVMALKEGRVCKSDVVCSPVNDVFLKILINRLKQIIRK
jgi:hypothetical protein